MQYTLERIAGEVEGKVENGEGTLAIKGIANVDSAEPGDIVMFYDLKFIEELIKSPCAAVVVPEKLVTNEAVKGRINKPLVVVKNERAALLKLLELFFGRQEREHFSGIHPSAVVHPSAKLGANAAVGACAVIDQDAVIGENTVVYPGCYVGKNVRTGGNCVLFAGVKLYRGTIIGDNTILHSGTVVGSDGFGYVTVEGVPRKVLQAGIVEIGSGVEIGANCAIDRATLGKTTIGDGTKLDNLVHIAHNVKIGKNCLIAGQVGIAGSARIGNGVMTGGQVGVADHVTVGDNSILAAQAGVIGTVKAGEFVTGFPARPVKEFMKAQAVLYQWTNKKQSRAK